MLYSSRHPGGLYLTARYSIHYKDDCSSAWYSLRSSKLANPGKSKKASSIFLKITQSNAIRAVSRIVLTDYPLERFPRRLETHKMGMKLQACRGLAGSWITRLKYLVLDSRYWFSPLLNEEKNYRGENLPSYMMASDTYQRIGGRAQRLWQMHRNPKTVLVWWTW